MQLVVKKSLLCGCFVCLMLVAPAWAGGDDDDSEQDAATDGPSYYGFVWDARGATIKDAKVVLRGKTGPSVETKSNLMGLYRSHIRKEVRPEDAIVSCEKAGYKQTKAVRRAHPDTTASKIEIDCFMQKN
jgi:hypothetical protein